MKYALLNNSRNNCHSNYLYKKTSADTRAIIFVSYGTHAMIIFLGGFMWPDAGHRGNKIPAIFRRHFARKTVMASRNVNYFPRLRKT